MHHTPAIACAIYGLAYAAGAYIFWRVAQLRSMDTRAVFHVMIAGLLGGLVGANLAQALAGEGAGKSILGAGLGGWLCVEIYKRRIGLRRSTGDLFALAVTGGEAVGRLGCFAAGCCGGRECSLPWAVYQNSAWRHPTQIYMSLWSIIVLLILWNMLQRSWPESSLFWMQGILAAAGRFVVEFVREGSRGAWGLTTAQWVCCALLLLFGAGGVRLILTTQRGLTVGPAGEAVWRETLLPGRSSEINGAKPKYTPCVQEDGSACFSDLPKM
jgi:phosphatidylglycerol:prolipoprotein diacylglycerol transferase